MSKAIEVRDLSKLYRIGEIGTGTVTQDLQRWWQMNVLGKEDPYLKIGEVNDREQKGRSDVVYSLRDVNFDIEQGDAVAIIGKNGAGKSTLLKILSRVTSPTTGRVKIKGRVASLLEVGTGFHPELTGRENIYLNGGILGMRKKEITRKLDEIIDFSGVERYIDTPVKRYSSGMYVRLAFAVAAHLDSEILIVDEVLSVGDAEFQKKCLGKMTQVTQSEGRTVLFVSHNMDAASVLCDSGVLLTEGQVRCSGTIHEVTKEYYSLIKKNDGLEVQIDKGILSWIGISNKDSLVNLNPYRDLDIRFQVRFLKVLHKPFYLDCGIYDDQGRLVIHSKSDYISRKFNYSEKDFLDFTYNVSSPNLSPGSYFLTVYFFTEDGPFLWIGKIPAFNVKPEGDKGILQGVRSVVIPKFSIDLLE